jgi:CHAT domain-containing protein
VSSIRGQVSDMHSLNNHRVIRTMLLVLFLSVGSIKACPPDEEPQVLHALHSAGIFLSANAPDSALQRLLEVDRKVLIRASVASLTEYYLMTAKAYQVKGIADSTRKFNDIALDQYEKGGLADPQLMGDILFLKGWLLLRARDTDSAGYWFHEALETATAVQNDSLASLVYRSLGNIHLSKRDYPSALEFYDMSYKVEMNRGNVSEAHIAALFQNKGIIFAALDNHDSAKYYFERSLNLKEKIQSSSDPSLATSFMNYSRFLMINGDLTESLAYMNKAEAIFLSVYGEDYQELGPFYINKGSLLILLNRFEEALTYLELSYRITKMHLSPEDPFFIKIFNNLGIVYENLGNYNEAIKYHKASLASNLDPEEKVKSLRWLASCYANIDNFEKASEFYVSAINEAEKNLGKNHWQTAATYHRYGSFLNTIDELRESLLYLEKSLKGYVDIFGTKNRDVSNVLTSIGLLYENMEHHRTALQYYQEALISFIPFFEEKDFYHNPDLDNLEPDLNIFNALYNKSFSFYNLYKTETRNFSDLEASLKTIELTIDLYQNITSGLDTENSRLLLMSRVNEIYNLAVKVTAEIYAMKGNHKFLNLAFSFSEKSKASVLLSLIRETEAMHIGNIPETLRIKETEIKSEIAHYRNLIFEEKLKTEPNSTRIGQWQATLNNKRLAYDSLVGLLEKEYPEYYNLKYNFDVVSIPEIQHKLDKDFALIEYKLVDSVLYTFIIRKDEAILKEVFFEEGLISEIQTFISLMNTFPDVTNVHKNSSEFAALGERLYKKLFPLEMPSQSGLIIIPDDILGYLSFDALVTGYPGTGNLDYRKINYLIQRHPIYYGYSATLLFNDGSIQTRKKDLLAMAPVYKTGQITTVYQDTSLRDINKLLTPLQFTFQEVENITKKFRGRSLIGNEATESNFKTHASDYNILHFAMHTLINDENPFASKLVFSMDVDTVDDGFLNTYEIYNLELNAELAVLSACQTGVGKLNRGEGIMSLARGFFYAGVPGIVMTLWAIEDVSSAEIITSFYGYLKSGATKDHALRNAKLDYLERANQLEAHPYFWAAYVQIGNNSPLSAKRPSFGIYFIPLILLLIIGPGIWVIRKNKKSRL